ncbi:predicted protein [Plenodomus lingam JN3]|uniref:Predicted protein n=1 Tax=Leptosphaeria maculans (strain JN3 / isolate v23.1.3 / race Av1-4-5-6-7-8) TaxID=985895 RepID=E4ZNM8_LEPMJ|nr:predicted protein [Plenodomus lingam JN3]CBX93247.1 predicted protein [Plenodomus lingam JN3]
MSHSKEYEDPLESLLAVSATSRSSRARCLWTWLSKHPTPVVILAPWGATSTLHRRNFASFHRIGRLDVIPMPVAYLARDLGLGELFVGATPHPRAHRSFCTHLQNKERRPSSGVNAQDCISKHTINAQRFLTASCQSVRDSIC